MARQRVTGDPRQLRRGKISINKQRSAIDCKVWDLSDLEACLEVKSALALPPKFDLLITGEKAARHCVVRSAVKSRVTVIFTDPRQKAPRRDSARKVCQQHVDLSAQPPPTYLSRGSLAGLRSSLDEAEFGVVLLDADLRATFMNRAFRKLWRLPDALAASPKFSDLMSHGRALLAPEARGLNEYVEEILTHVKGGDPTPVGMRLIEGEVLRFQCIALPHGGRMLSYTKVTDIVRRGDECEVLRAAIDNVDQGIVIVDENLVVQFINRQRPQDVETHCRAMRSQAGLLATHL